MGIPDGRNGECDVNQSAVFSSSYSLRIDSFSPMKLRDNFGCLVRALGWNQNSGRFSQDLVGRVAVKPLGSLVPIENRCIQRYGEDGIIRIVDDGGELLPGPLRMPPLSDVSNGAGN
jgi:hypothetical protein